VDLLAARLLRWKAPLPRRLGPTDLSFLRFVGAVRDVAFRRGSARRSFGTGCGGAAWLRATREGRWPSWVSTPGAATARDRPARLRRGVHEEDVHRRLCEASSSGEAAGQARRTCRQGLTRPRPSLSLGTPPRLAGLRTVGNRARRRRRICRRSLARA